MTADSTKFEQTDYSNKGPVGVWVFNVLLFIIYIALILTILPNINFKQ